MNRIIVRPGWRANSIPGRKRYAIISISDPPLFSNAAPTIRKSKRVERVLRMEFLGNDPADVQLWAIRRHAMTSEHARLIWDFISDTSAKIDALAVQDVSGIDMAPSIAMAVADVLDISRKNIDWAILPFSDPPNKRVYQITRENAPAIHPCDPA